VRAAVHSPRGRAALGLGLGAVITVAALGGCSGSDGAGRSDVTLPSSLSVPATVPGAGGTTVGPSPSTTEVPPTSPAADGAPIIRSLVAEPGATSCTAGTIPAVVTFEVADQPPVRVLSVFLDGAPGGSSNTVQPITVAAVPCDGGVHTVLLIATGVDGQSSTQAVAFRAPQLS
jgi:hypothetical protein